MGLANRVLDHAFLFQGVDASQDRNSFDTGAGLYGKPFDVGMCQTASVHLIWSGFVGTGGVVAVYVSNTGDPADWVPKSKADGSPVQLTLTGAAGKDLFSLNCVVSEQYYALVYTKGSVTAGSLTAKAVGK